jgi:sortase A
MVAKGLWIPAKAELAQFLLERAWQKTLDSSEGRAAENSRTLHFKPWSWADTWPVARLTLPDPSGRQGRSLIVLAGTSGQAMAFGPGMQEHHPLDSGEFSQNLVIGGHRDTHFAGLQHLAAGEVLDLQLPGESPRRYRVNRLLVTHESDRSVLLPSSRQQLTLVTCYPFDAIIPGGPLRFVVQAERLS